MVRDMYRWYSTRSRVTSLPMCPVAALVLAHLKAVQMSRTVGLYPWRTQYASIHASTSRDRAVGGFKGRVVTWGLLAWFLSVGLADLKEDSPLRTLEESLRNIED